MPSPDEVVDALSRIGVHITRRTLLNYEKWGLIFPAKQGGGGRGKGGRWAEYPMNSIYEAYAAYKLIHGKYGDEYLQKLLGSKSLCLSPETTKALRDKFMLEKTEIFEGAIPLEYDKADLNTKAMIELLARYWEIEGKKAYKLLSV